MSVLYMQAPHSRPRPRQSCWDRQRETVHHHPSHHHHALSVRHGTRHTAQVRTCECYYITLVGFGGVSSRCPVTIGLMASLMQQHMLCSAAEKSKFYCRLAGWLQVGGQVARRQAADDDDETSRVWRRAVYYNVLLYYTHGAMARWQMMDIGRTLAHMPCGD